MVVHRFREAQLPPGIQGPLSSGSRRVLPLAPEASSQSDDPKRTCNPGNRLLFLDTVLEPVLEPAEGSRSDTAELNIDYVGRDRRSLQLIDDVP
jgi:hypothetical protein